MKGTSAFQQPPLNGSSQDCGHGDSVRLAVLSVSALGPSSARGLQGRRVSGSGGPTQASGRLALGPV